MLAVAAVHRIARHTTAILATLVIGTTHTTTLTTDRTDLATLVTNQAETAFGTGIAALAIIGLADLGTRLGATALGQADLVF